MYYKIRKEDRIVDAMDGLVTVRWDSMGILLRCPEASAQGIVSTDGEHVWHVDGWDEFPEAAGEYETVTPIEITAEEYEEVLAELIDSGVIVIPDEPNPEDLDPVIPDPDEGDDPIRPMTRAELTAKVAELEEELAATKILLGVDE